MRQRDGELLTTDGPYTEGKEHIGGLLIVKAPDLDAALEWGRQATRAIGLPIDPRSHLIEEFWQLRSRNVC